MSRAAAGRAEASDIALAAGLSARSAERRRPRSRRGPAARRPARPASATFAAAVAMPGGRALAFELDLSGLDTPANASLQAYTPARPHLDPNVQALFDPFDAPPTEPMSLPRDVDVEVDVLSGPVDLDLGVDAPEDSFIRNLDRPATVRVVDAASRGRGAARPGPRPVAPTAPTPAGRAPRRRRALAVSRPPPPGRGRRRRGDDELVKVVGPLRISIPLFNIYLNEADELSRRLTTEVAEWAMELHRPIGEAPIALAHSLAGSSATVGFADLSHLARVLEHAQMRSQAIGHGTPGGSPTVRRGDRGNPPPVASVRRRFPEGAVARIVAAPGRARGQFRASASRRRPPPTSWRRRAAPKTSRSRRALRSRCDRRADPRRTCRPRTVAETRVEGRRRSGWPAARSAGSRRRAPANTVEPRSRSNRRTVGPERRCGLDDPRSAFGVRRAGPSPLGVSGELAAASPVEASKPVVGHARTGRCRRRHRCAGCGRRRAVSDLRGRRPRADPGAGRAAARVGPQSRRRLEGRRLHAHPAHAQGRSAPRRRDASGRNGAPARDPHRAPARAAAGHGRRCRDAAGPWRRAGAHARACCAPGDAPEDAEAVAAVANWPAAAGAPARRAALPMPAPPCGARRTPRRPNRPCRRGPVPRPR